MTTSTIAEVIARLKLVPHGTRELDVAIQAIVNPARHQWNEAETEKLIAAARKNGLTDRDEGCRRSAFYSTPQYTTSLDAALTLVPDGWSWNIHHGFAIDAELMFSRKGSLAMPEKEVSVHDAVSAPIALCIAALRARQEKE